MANNIWNNSDADNDGNNPNNWSLGWVPKAGDTAYYDATSLTACNFSGALSCDAINVTSAFSSGIDFNNQDITTTGDQTYDGSGYVLCGTGTITCGGHFDNKDQSGWTRETSTLVMSGTAKNLIVSGYLYALTISGTITLSTETPSRMRLYGPLVVDLGAHFTFERQAYLYGNITNAGSITANPANAPPLVYTPGSTFTNTGTVDGAGSFSLRGQTVTGNGTWSVAATNTTFDLTLNLGTYGGTWTITNGQSGTNHTMTVGGNLVFTGPVSIDADTADDYTVDNSGNHDLTFQGDMACSATVGTLIWTKGSGTITLSGANDQDIDFNGLTVEDIVVNKSAGNFVLTGDIDPDSWTGTSTGTGDCDPNGKTITTTGNCSWAAAFLFDAAADCLNGCSWIVGGNFTADGQTLPATAAWYLQVTGTAVASGAGTVAYSDASGFTEVTANGWTNAGNNVNWDFGAGPSPHYTRRRMTGGMVPMAAGVM